MDWMGESEAFDQDDGLRGSSERRRYYRIQDDVGLSYRVLEGGEIDDALHRFAGEVEDSVALASALTRTGEEMHRHLDGIRRELPHVASYLENLNEKLDILARLVVAREAGIPSRPTHSVSLSACGMAFDVRTPIAAGSLMEVRLVLFPLRVCMSTLAAVVNCELLPGTGHERFRIAVDFSHIQNEDREQLIRHILRTQSEELRRIRGPED